MSVEVAPCGPVLGAEEASVRIGESVDVETAALLRELLVRHKVLFLRDLDLTHEQHLALGRVSGRSKGTRCSRTCPAFPKSSTFAGPTGASRMRRTTGLFRTLDKRYTDVTFRAVPSLGAVLRARRLPAIGGDTLRADATAAYEGLPDEVQAKIEGRTATHDILFDLAAASPDRSHASRYRREDAVRQRELHRAGRRLSAGAATHGARDDRGGAAVLAILARSRPNPMPLAPPAVAARPDRRGRA